MTHRAQHSSRRTPPTRGPSGACNIPLTQSIHLGAVDWTILVLYFATVVGIGAALKHGMKSSNDFFLSGRNIPAWISGLAFLSANLGAQEVMGMAASGAKYGMMTSHFYWVGAVPAMVFVGVFMMPFYYGSKARSVPEYLKLRYDEKTRTFNAFSFATMTVFSSGISMYAMAKLLHLLLGWNFDVALWASAAIVLAYIVLGGLTSAIYNEVMQFFLIVLGFAPLVFLGLRDAGGWSGLVSRLDLVATQSYNVAGQPYAAGAWVSAWHHMGSPTSNPMGVEWFGMVMGLGFVLSFGYWCTDFLVVQRAMVAENAQAARRVPLIAAVPKMIFPFLVILPGMIAIALTYQGGQTNFSLPVKGNAFDYDMTIPLMLKHYFPTGLLGLGLTALMASFMSGMAGNVTAFNTVWTYDIYQGHIAPNKSDAHYLRMGKLATVFGTILSILTAYMAQHFNNIMDMLQLVFAFVNAPLFATFLLGMFWKRTTGHGAFYGLLAGTCAAALHHGLTIPVGAESVFKGGWIGTILHMYPSEMAQNFWTAIWSWTTCCVVTIVISLLTKRLKSDEELRGLVYSLTERRADRHLAWYQRPVYLGGLILVSVTVLNLAFL